MVQTSGRSNWIQWCQQLASAATFLLKKLCFLGNDAEMAPKNCYTLRRNTASISKDFIGY